MDLDELKERYKNSPFYLRLLLGIFLGSLIGLYVYLQEGEAYEIELQSETENRRQAKTQFENTQKRKENLPKLEEQLAFTEEQLEKAKTKMPDTIHMEEILQRIAAVGKEMDLKIQEFDPQNQVYRDGDFRYAEVPIRVRVVGKYFQVTGFFDRVAHLEKLIHIRNIALKGEIEPDANAVLGNNARIVVPEQEANLIRNRIRVVALADLVVFRGLKPGEAIPAEVNAPGAAGAAPGAPNAAAPPNGAPPAPGAVPGNGGPPPQGAAPAGAPAPAAANGQG